jgi:hypothetical protein
MKMHPANYLLLPSIGCGLLSFPSLPLCAFAGEIIGVYQHKIPCAT